MDTSLPRGIRDIEPEEFQLQAKVRAAFEDVARIYNFRVMEPASIEHLSTLRAKSGEEVDKEIYTFKDKAGRDIGLRFDLTVGIARYVCSRRDLKMPAKIAAFGGMWRYDEPQYGRFRWSHQWDLEIFGPPAVDSDAEVIDASAAILKRVGLERATIEVGDRRVVEGFIRDHVGVTEESRVVELMRALDKVEKKTRLELEQEYESKGFARKELGQVLDLGDLSGKPEDVLRRASEMRLSSTEDLERLFDILRSRGVKNVECNMRIVRGIDYYTGIVFEAVDTANPKLGSLCGGGRYDALPKIRLGQPATTLSGGEAQRVKLSSELSRRSTGRTLYILDEPTTGLSFEDAAALLQVLQRLADAGNTVVLIEHHLDMIKNADYIIDLGPGAGDKGGYVIATGTPEEIVKVKKSYTGQYLANVLSKNAARKV